MSVAERVSCRAYAEHRSAHRWTGSVWNCNACNPPPAAIAAISQGGLTVEEGPDIVEFVLGDAERPHTLGIRPREDGSYAFTENGLAQFVAFVVNEALRQAATTGRPVASTTIKQVERDDRGRLVRVIEQTLA